MIRINHYPGCHPRIPLFRILSFVLFISVSVAHTQWQQIPGTAKRNFSAMTGFGGTIFAACEESVFSLRNAHVTRIIPINDIPATPVIALAAEPPILYVATGRAIFRLLPDSEAWRMVALSPDTGFFSMAVWSGHVIAGTKDGKIIRIARDPGEESRTDQVAGMTTTLRSIITVKGYLIAGSMGGGVFINDRSTDRWRSFSAGLPNRFIYSLAVDGSDILAGAVNGTICRAHPGSDRWKIADRGLPYNAIRAICVVGSTAIAGTWGKGIYEETDRKFEWCEISEGLSGEDAATVNAICVAGPYIFAATGDGLWCRPLSELAIPIENRRPADIPEE